MLAIRPATMREAVRATEDFLAVHTAGPQPRAHVVEQPKDNPEDGRCARDDGLLMMAEALKQQTVLLQQILMQTAQQPAIQPASQTEVQPARQPVVQPAGQPVRQTAGQPATQVQLPVKCYGCGGPHFKRGCPMRQQGNGGDLAQR